MRASRRSSRREGLPAAAILAALLGALPLAAPAPAQAQEPAKGRPSLAGHTFVSTELVPDAFVRTYVRNSLGYAQASDIQFASVVFEGDTLLSLQGDLAYALLGLEYQQRVNDWLAARLSIGARTRLGTQVSSLVAEGVTVGGGMDFGWLARIKESGRTALCASLAVSNQTSTVVDIKRFVQDVIDGAPNPVLVDNVPTLRTLGGMRFAWAASRVVGVTALAEGSYGESPLRGEPDSWEYGWGASVDYDAGPDLDVPVGAALAYRQTSIPLLATSQAGVLRETVLRVAYNARPDFLVSIDVLGVMNRETGQPDPVKALGVTLGMRYYF